MDSRYYVKRLLHPRDIFNFLFSLTKLHWIGSHYTLFATVSITEERETKLRRMSGFIDVEFTRSNETVHARTGQP